MEIKTGIIPAAGTGIRTSYLSAILPKCLLPVYDKPILHYIITNMVTSGLTDIRIVINYKGEMIKKYVDSMSLPEDIRVNFITQEVLNGDGNAVKLAIEDVKNPFIVILGDDVTFPNPITSMIQIYNQKHPLIIEGIVSDRNWDRLRNACAVNILDDHITDIIEKPQTYQDLPLIRGCGVYLFNPSVFEYISCDHLWISDIIKKNISANKVMHCVLDSNINVNTPDDLIAASLMFKEKTHS